MKSDETLQRCLEEMETLHLSVSEYLAVNPGLEELEDPLRAAETLRDLSMLSMRPEVIYAQEQRLREAVRAYPPAPSAQTRSRVGRGAFGASLLRLVFALLLIISLVLASAGTAMAASASFPGEMLYPVKQTLEAVQVRLTPASGQASLHAGLAEERSEEVVVLSIRRARADLFESTAAAMTAETQAALEYVDEAAPALQSPLLERLVSLIDRQQAFLVAVKDQVPPQAAASLEQALLATHAHAAQAQALLDNSHDDGGGQGATQQPETQIAGRTTPPATDTEAQPVPTQVPPSQAGSSATLTDEPITTTGPAPFRTPTHTRMPSTTTTNPTGSTGTATRVTPNAATPLTESTDTPTGPPMPLATATPTQAWIDTPADARTSTPTPSPTATPTMVLSDTAVLAYQGCGHSYWNQAVHVYSWFMTGYGPGDDFNAIFGVSAAFTPHTLLAAVGLGGGGEQALARHAVAALLNAAHPDVYYRYTVNEVIGGVQNAYATGEFESVKNLLEDANQAGCPLN
jgi:hypothetical protein